MWKRIAIVGTTSGAGKTTLGRALAQRIGAPFLELDSVRHGPNWTVRPDEDIRAVVVPFVAGETWVIDNIAERILGGAVIDRAEIVVWLDLPPHVFLPRLVLRSGRRLVRREALWNGNRESLRGVLWDRDGVIPHALRGWFVRRPELAARLLAHQQRGVPLVRLCSPREVDAWVRVNFA